MNKTRVDAINVYRIPIVEDLKVRKSIDDEFKKSRRPKSLRKWIGYMLVTLGIYSIIKEIQVRILDNIINKNR